MSACRHLIAAGYAVERGVSDGAHLLGWDIYVWDLVLLAEHRDVGDDIDRRDVPSQNADPAADLGGQRLVSRLGTV